MRQIKFRAWNHVTKKYFTPSELRCENGEFVYTTACDGKFALEQFTGLKDKNGEEIYEGDLMTHPEFGEDDVLLVQIIDGCTYASGWDCVRTWLDQGEVIGNIHENPEMIKGIK